MAINNNINEEFLVKILEDQQKVYAAFIKLINKLGAPWSLCHMEIYQSYLDGGSRLEKLGQKKVKDKNCSV